MYSTTLRIEKPIGSTRKSAIGRWHVETLRRDLALRCHFTQKIPRSGENLSV